MPAIALNTSTSTNGKASPLTALGGMYGNNPAISSLLTSLQAGQDQANAAGNKQYGDLMANINGMGKNLVGKGGEFSRAAGDIDKAGLTARNRIGEDLKNQQGALAQNAVSRGLNNFSLQQVQQAGASKDAERKNQELDSTLAQQRAGVRMGEANAAMQIGGMKSDAILSKVNEGPQIDQYLALIQSLMQNGGGQQRSTMTSNRGSITAANGPNTAFSNFDQRGGGQQQAPVDLSSLYYNAGGGGVTTPRAGDTFFGGSPGTMGGGGSTQIPYAPGSMSMAPTDTIFNI